jgi:hypothetical protein
MPKESEISVKVTPKGHCTACGGAYTKTGMAKHLANCPARLAQQFIVPNSSRQKIQAGQLLHVEVEGQDNPIYWMHLEVPGQATLVDLDNFLRDFWLECCGHLSTFEIEGVRYAVMPDTEYGFDEKNMRGVKLDKVLSSDQRFDYEYDYGSTTNLKLKVIAVREGQYVGGKGKAVKLLAQNEAPEISCDKCKRIPAVVICTECRWHGEGWLCEVCRRKHTEHSDFFLPVVNSPRVGECGYVG